MARRSDIDWEAIERDYRAGMLTIAAISGKYGVSESQIKLRAKKGEWPRDLSAAIKARTKAKVAAIDVSALVEQSAAESAGKSAEIIREAIEQASDVAAGVIVRHRADIRMQQERAQNLEALLDEHMHKAETIGDVARAAQAFKSLVDARAKLMDKEREAYGIESGSTPGDGDDVASIEVTFVDGRAER